MSGNAINLFGNLALDASVQEAVTAIEALLTNAELVAALSTLQAAVVAARSGDTVTISGASLGALTAARAGDTVALGSATLTTLTNALTAIVAAVQNIPAPASVTGLATQTTLASLLSKTDDGTGSGSVLGLLKQILTASQATTVDVATLDLSNSTVQVNTTAMENTLTAIQGILTNTTMTQTQGAAIVAALSSVPITATALPLPTGAATDSKLEAIRALLAGTLAVSLSGTVTASDATTHATLAAIQSLLSGTLTVSVTGSVLPSGAATDTSVQAVTTKLGGTLKVDGSATTQPVSGSVSVANLPATQAVNWTGTPSVSVSGTVPVSAASLPLPTGAAADSSVTAVTASLGTDGSGETPPSGTGVRGWLRGLFDNTKALSYSASGLKVDGSSTTQPVSGSVAVSNLPATQAVSGSVGVSNFPASQTVTWTGNPSVSVSGTVPVSTTALPLPTGAATETTLGAIKTAVTSVVAVSGPLTATQLAAATVKVDGSAVTQPVSIAGTPTVTVSNEVEVKNDSGSPLSVTFPSAQHVTVDSLPAGLATSTAQDTTNTLLAGTLAVADASAEASLSAAVSALSTVVAELAGQLTVYDAQVQGSVDAVASILERQATMMRPAANLPYARDTADRMYVNVGTVPQVLVNNGNNATAGVQAGGAQPSYYSNSSWNVMDAREPYAEQINLRAATVRQGRWAVT